MPFPDCRRRGLTAFLAIRQKSSSRRKKTHVPKDIRFKTKPQIALDQIRAAHAAGVAPGIVLADAGYGCVYR